MKKVIAVGGGVSAGVILGPVVAGALGMEPTDGLDGADAVSIILGILVFFVLAWILGKF